MSDNPFHNPFAAPGPQENDPDRTVIRPMPGGKSGAARRPSQPTPPPVNPADQTQIAPRMPPPRPASRAPETARPDEPARAEPPPPIPPGADLAGIATAQPNKLAAAAAPLLQLLVRLRNAATPPDPGDIRERTVRQMREFEKRARDEGVPMDQLRPAHYALCAALDDAVLNTPWGANGRWRTNPLTATFHQDQRQGGDGFFDQLRILRKDPAAVLPVIELMYVCMALGFMGPYRATPDGGQRMERIREQTFEMIAKARPATDRALSPRWNGVEAPYRIRRTRFPVWVGLCIALAAVAGMFAWVLNGLNAGSDSLYQQMLAAEPAAMPQIVRAPFVQPPPPPPEPPPPGPADRLRAALAADKEIVVVPTPSAIILRLSADRLFPKPNAALAREAGPLLDRIGEALKAARGGVRVIGFEDNQHVRSVQFPSAFNLTTARALAVKNALAKPIGDASRLSSEGRGDAEPLANNGSPEGRTQNRRIEIVLQPAG